MGTMSSMVPIALSHGDGAPGAGRRWGRVEGQEDAECSDRRCHGFEKGKLYYEEPRKYCIANDFAFGICYPELGHPVFVLTFIFYFSATGPKGLPWRMADISRSIAVFVNTTHQRNWCSRVRRARARHPSHTRCTGEAGLEEEATGGGGVGG
jgi:hypothetical protein